MAVVIPPGMIQNRIQTDAVNWDAQAMGSRYFTANIITPACALVALGAGFGDDNRPAVTQPDFFEDPAEWPISCILSRQRFGIVHPLVPVIKIGPDNIEILRLTAQF